MMGSDIVIWHLDHFAVSAIDIHFGEVGGW